MEVETVEELQQRHRQEKRALQAKVQQLKKAAGKPDKKKKKELDQQIAQLEQQLRETQLRETEQLQPTEPQDPEECSELPQEEKEQANNDQKPQQRISKAQKRRDKKAASEAERCRQVEADDGGLEAVERAKESLAIKRYLRSRGLCLWPVPPDGDCLYSAVRHQLDAKGRTFTVSVLRRLAADHVRRHKTHFAPFICDPTTGDVLDDEQFETYCREIADTKAWGGQVELQALSATLKTSIRVVQADAPNVIVQGEEYAKSGDALVLTYHRRLYGLGEHYNSTKKLEDAESSQDEGEQ